MVRENDIPAALVLPCLTVYFFTDIFFLETPFVILPNLVAASIKTRFEGKLSRASLETILWFIAGLRQYPAKLLSVVIHKSIKKESER
jgi:hypothetical protein